MSGVVVMACKISSVEIQKVDKVYRFSSSIYGRIRFFFMLKNYLLEIPLLVVISTAQLYLTKPEIRFCAGSNPARCVSEIRNCKDLWQ